MVTRQPAFILNPTSGSGRGLAGWNELLLPRVRHFFGTEGVGWQLYQTQRSGHATELTMQAVEDGWNVIVSIGGDGTHNEVVNGYLRADAKARNVEMAIMSFGTGGDFCRTLFDEGEVDQLELVHSGPSIPIDAGYVISTSMDAPREPKPPPDDACPSTPTHMSSDSVGECNGEQAFESDSNHRHSNGSTPQPAVIVEGRPFTQTRYFLNISSTGIGGIICYTVNNSSKALGGFVSFVYQTCLQTLLWSNKPIEYRVDNDSEWRAINVYQLVMANGQYHGGGVFIAPQATLYDGQFQVVELRDIGVVDVSVLFKVYSGSHLDYSKVESRAGRSVEARPASDEDVLIEIDGESGGKLPASWHILPEAVQLIVPRYLHERYRRWCAEKQQQSPSSSASSSSLQDDEGTPRISQAQEIREPRNAANCDSPASSDEYSTLYKTVVDNIL